MLTQWNQWFTLGTKWNAILLISDCDTFMAKRTGGYDRNGNSHFFGNNLIYMKDMFLLLTV